MEEEEEVYRYKASYGVHVHLLQSLGLHCVHSLHCVVLFDYIVSIKLCQDTIGKEDTINYTLYLGIDMTIATIKGILLYLILIQKHVLAYFTKIQYLLYMYTIKIGAMLTSNQTN